MALAANSRKGKIYHEEHVGHEGGEENQPSVFCLSFMLFRSFMVFIRINQKSVSLYKRLIVKTLWPMHFFLLVSWAWIALGVIKSG